MTCGCLADVLARIERLERMMHVPAVLACAFCGKAINVRKNVTQALYCSASCRQQAYRRRKDQDDAPRRACARSGCEYTFAISDPRRIYCSERCRSVSNWHAKKRRALEAILRGARP